MRQVRKSWIASRSKSGFVESVSMIFMLSTKFDRYDMSKCLGGSSFGALIMSERSLSMGVVFIFAIKSLSNLESLAILRKRRFISKNM